MSHLWHPFTPDSFNGPKATWVRAQGAYVWDDQGHRFLDATSSWWCQIHGHCHPRLTQALMAQAKTLDHVMVAPHTHPGVEQLSDGLIRALGAPYSKVFYSDDGSTAVEAALKMALQYWHLKGQKPRQRFLSLHGGYHGDTLGAVSVGGIDSYHEFFQRHCGPSLKLPTPYCYRCPEKQSYPGCDSECLSPLESILEKHGSEIAALIVEPLLMGAAGMIAYPKEYLEKLVLRCQQMGILVIFDEVFTGFGRTGKMFAMDWLSVKPDIVTLSKGLTSGVLPLGATVTHDGIYREFCGDATKAFYHGHTFSGNALGCAVALESLKIFEDESVLERNQKLIDCMMAQREIFKRMERVGDVRQLGMVWAIELVQDKIEKLPLNIGWQVAQQMWDRGYWIRPLHNNLYIVPPYCVTVPELSGLFQALAECLEAS